jgi:hypothetical protein
MLEQERKFYAENLAEWLKLYPGKFVVVKGRELVGTFDTIEEAITEAARRFALDSVLVRRVQDQEETVSVPALTLGILRADTTRSV